MSRAGYADDCYDAEDYARMNLWTGAVRSAIRGRRGQAFLRELVEALDALPVKRLIAEELAAGSGEVCAIGAVGRKRGTDMSRLDPEDWDAVAGEFGIAAALVREIEYTNDEEPWYGLSDEVCRLPPEERRRAEDEARFLRVRGWALEQLREAP